MLQPDADSETKLFYHFDKRAYSTMVLATTPAFLFFVLALHYSVEKEATNSRRAKLPL